ncbi:hypothetical protein ACQUY5_27120 [Bacillus cereus]|uniref:hypothetical protein n=1 Tax=Bacillus cereus TaxID=1396 RepID=UPI003D165B4A
MVTKTFDTLKELVLIEENLRKSLKNVVFAYMTDETTYWNTELSGKMISIAVNKNGNTRELGVEEEAQYDVLYNEKPFTNLREQLLNIEHKDNQSLEESIKRGVASNVLFFWLHDHREKMQESLDVIEEPLLNVLTKSLEELIEEKKYYKVDVNKLEQALEREKKEMKEYGILLDFTNELDKLKEVSTTYKQMALARLEG